MIKPAETFWGCRHPPSSATCQRPPQAKNPTFVDRDIITVNQPACTLSNSSDRWHWWTLLLPCVCFSSLTTIILLCTNVMSLVWCAWPVACPRTGRRVPSLAYGTRRVCGNIPRKFPPISSFQPLSSVGSPFYPAKIFYAKHCIPTLCLMPLIRHSLAWLDCPLYSFLLTIQANSLRLARPWGSRPAGKEPGKIQGHLPKFDLELPQGHPGTGKSPDPPPPPHPPHFLSKLSTLISYRLLVHK